MRVIIGVVMLTALAVAGTEELKRISNPGFEETAEGKITEWSFFVREKGKGSFALAEDAAAGRYAARIVNECERDWAFINKTYTGVKPGQFFEVKCRMKRVGGKGAASLTVVGLHGKELVNW